LIRLLETLARVEMTESSALVAFIQEQRYQLAWGTTLIVITGSANDELLNELHQARRWGQDPVLILAGRDIPDVVIRRRAKTFGVEMFGIATEHDLEIWTRPARESRHV
jgi:hypothetical protein